MPSLSNSNILARSTSRLIVRLRGMSVLTIICTFVRLVTILRLGGDAKSVEEKASPQIGETKDGHQSTLSLGTGSVGGNCHPGPPSKIRPINELGQCKCEGGLTPG